MSNLSRLLLAAVAVLSTASMVRAQQQPESKPLRVEITPVIGYRSPMSFPIQEPDGHVEVDASPSFGVSFGVRFRNYDDLVEARWIRQDSQIYSEGNTPERFRQRFALDQFHGDFSHEYLVEDWGALAKPFVVASLGATHISSTANNFTRFSFGIGGGVRFYSSRHLYFKIQAEWLPIVLDSNAAFVCGGGCVVHLRATVASQGEVVAGPTFRF